MIEQRFRIVCEIFDQVRTLPVGHRDTFLVEACGDDQDLLREVRELLSHHDHENGMLDQPATPISPLLLTPDEVPLPSRIGRYTILRKLGGGGMGVVYLARQDDPAREVAIKVMRSGLLDKDMIKRFALETTVLGRLQHPGVAQIYEAGIHDDGGLWQPYFAMEFVEGRNLGQYLRDTQPPIRARLQLFLKISEAVHHAHQKGIIHRDLKPGNILIQADADRPAGGIPKILDFGVARATDADLQATTYLTDAGQLVGTLPYMSPEQVSGNSKDVDTRSDVYALGVILYEMLTGQLPYDLDQRSMVAAARTIMESDPIHLTRVDRAFRGDLNTIVLKTLEKNPDRRYESAADLAADIRRFLNNQPVLARPASAIYQLKKFAQRHRGLVGGIAATFVVLIAGIAGTTWQAVSATRQRALAEAKAEFASDVNKFLYGVLISAHSVNLGQNATIRDAVHRAAKSFEDDPPENPQVEFEIRRTIGAALEAVGDYEGAEQHLRAAQESGRSSSDGEEARTLELLGMVLLRRGSYEEAEEKLNASLQLRRRMGDESELHVARTLTMLADLVKGTDRLTEAERMALQALEIHQRHTGDEDEESNTLSVLARVLRRQGKLQQSEAIQRESIDMATSTFGRDSAHVARGLNSLAILYGETSRTEASIPLFREVIRIQSSLLGDDHPDLAVTRTNLGSALDYLGRYDEAEEELVIAAAILEQRLGPDHPTVLAARSTLGNLMMATERLDQAAAIYEDVLARKTRVLGPQHFHTTISQLHVAAVHRQRGEYDLAASLINTALAARREHLGNEHPRTLSALGALAENLRAAGDAAGCESILREIYQRRLSRLGSDHEETRVAVEQLADLLRELGRDAEADAMSGLSVQVTKP